MPTANETRRKKYMMGDVWKLSDMLRVSGKISQQTIKPTAINRISMIIKQALNSKSDIYERLTFFFVGENRLFVCPFDMGALISMNSAADTKPAHMTTRLSGCPSLPVASFGIPLFEGGGAMGREF